MQNCSKWPLVTMPQAPGGVQPQAVLPAECLAMQGKPYESNQARDWYLRNCQPTPVPRTPAASSGPDRQNCDEIRGSAYRSTAERAWYAANCGNAPPGATATPAGATATPAGADRQNCGQIRGTGYRSAGERNWYFQNCFNR